MFVVSHLVGDFVLQTDWQARHKPGGLGADPVARRALVSHVATYTLAFVPAFIWLASDLGWAVVGVAAAISIPHLLQDDTRALRAFIREVKGVSGTADDLLFMCVDQSFHFVALFGAALLAAELA